MPLTSCVTLCKSGALSGVWGAELDCLSTLAVHEAAPTLHLIGDIPHPATVSVVRGHM